MKKKIVSILLATVMTTSALTGCGNSDTQSQEPKNQESTENTTSETTETPSTESTSTSQLPSVTARDNEEVDLLDNYEVLQAVEDGSYQSDYFLETSVDTVTWGRLPNKDSEPVLTVESGSTVTIDTLSHEGILEDQGKDPVAYFTGKGVPEDMILEDAIEIAASDLPHNFDEDGPHVITGPIYVEGAEAGDVLKVEVLSLTPRVPYGVISNRHYKGCLVDEFPENEGRLDNPSSENPEAYNNVSIFAPIKKIGDEYYGYLDDGNGSELSFKINPFLGTMGVAANSSEKASTVPPTRLGGNLDINELGVGSTLYLPIDVDGALFYTGDPHFAQGDGEVALTALEGSLRATVRLTVIKNGTDEVPGDNNSFDMAFGETENYWIPIGLNEDLDEAMKMSVRESIDFLSEEFTLDRALVYAYLSAGTDYEVSQVVDKTKGIHALVEKTDFAPYITTQLQVEESTFPVTIIDESYYVEAEPVLIALGAEVTKNNNTYTIKYEDISYELRANSNVYVTPNGNKLMDLSPVYQNDSLYIPVSSFLNIFRIPLNWSSANGTVTGTLGY